jgi:hypothetical protein
MIEKLQNAAVSKFSSSSVATGLIQQGILGVDVGGQTDGLRWIFSGDQDDRPYRDPEGTGKTAVVFTVNGSWGTNLHNTARFPVLTVLIYSDSTRGLDGRPTSGNGKTRGLAVADAIIKVFHDPAKNVHVWPNGVYVHSCLYAGGPNAQPVPDSDGMSRISLEFNIETD